MLLIIRNWKISELIRGRVHSKLPFYAAFLLKAVSFLALSVCLLPAFQGAQLLVNTMQMKQELEKQQGILTLASYRYTGHEFQDTLNGIKTLETKLYSLFRLLEEECQAGFVSSYLVGYETILFSRDLWDDLPDFHPLPEKMYPVMTVNENYGDHLIQSLKIPDYEPRQAITLLVSDSWMDNGNPSSALRFLERYVQRNEDPDSTQRPDYAVYTYPAGQTVFSDSVDLAEQGYTWLKDPVIVILPPSALERKKSWLLDSASSNPIRLEDTPQNMVFLKKAVQNLDLEENHLVFSSLLHSGYIQSIQGYQRVLILWTGVLFFFILVSIVSSWLLVMMILKIQKQRMTVSHLLGISFFHRYRWEWTGTAVIYLSGLLILLTEKAAPEVLMVYGILAGSDLAITAFLLIRQDRESISESLKGRH